jgi:predicted pyridoxine 5'-phosphate oxidase superfamily flavin-nucleotide-binding protein
MGKIFERIEPRHCEWIAKQALFFVGTAPLDPEGHVNVSPKGPIGSLRVLDDHTVAYLDVFGSGTETIGHLRENGRIVVMLCAFDGPPRILRLHGRGEVVRTGEERFDELYRQAAFEEPSLPEAHRAIVVVDVTRVADSCGYGVPLMDFRADRDHHALSVAKNVRVLGADGYRDSRTERSAETLDGLPAL